MDRRLSVDILKIVLAVMVVGIHASPVRQFGHGAVNLAGQGLFRIAVPAFFVINGYYFQAVAHAGRAWPYIKRLLWLYVLWMLIYLPFWYSAFLSPDPLTLPRMWILGWWQFWYLPALAIAAGLAALVRDWRTPALVALMLAILILGLAIAYGVSFRYVPAKLPYFGSATPLHRNGLFLGFPFLMAGFLIRRHAIDKRIGLAGALALTVLGIALILTEAVTLDYLDDTGIARDNLLSIAIASPAVVLLALQFDRKSPNKTLGTYANGIFFCHAAFVIVAMRFTDLVSWQVYLLAIAGSVAITWLLNRTGLGQRLL